MFLLVEMTGVHCYRHRRMGELGHVFAFGHARIVSAFLLFLICEWLGFDHREII